MNHFAARAGVDGSRLLGDPFGYDGLGAPLSTDVPPEGFTINYGDLRWQLGQAAAARDAVLAQIEAIYDAAISAGFRVGSGLPWYVVGIPAMGGTNEQLVVLNAQNTAQKDAWNADLATLWPQLPPLIEAMRAIEARINAVTAAGPSEGGVPQSGLPAGEVLSWDELEAKRIRESVVVSGQCIPFSTWNGISPAVRQLLPSELICRVGDTRINPSRIANDSLPSSEPVIDFRPPVPIEEIVPVTTLIPDDDLPTTTVPKVPKLPSVFASFRPPVDEIVEAEPVATAGFGGMFGLLALGGLALAVLVAPKRKR